jgi:predicted metal-dependent RNase
VRLTFLGAAGEVTGSCYLVDTGAVKFLVECGMFPGRTRRGEEYAVLAKVFTIGGLSAHADRSALLGWIAKFRRPPRQTWVVHGEPLAAYSLCEAINQKPGWRAAVPTQGNVVDL